MTQEDKGVLADLRMDVAVCDVQHVRVDLPEKVTTAALLLKNSLDFFLEFIVSPLTLQVRKPNSCL